MDLKPGYKQTEAGVIPEDWDAKPLAGLAAIIHGFGFQSQYFKPLGNYRLTTPGHFYETGGFRDVGDKQKFYDGPLPDGYILSEGDLLVVMTEQADGLLGSAAFVPTGGTYIHNQRLGKIKVLSPEVSIRFLYRVFNSKSYRAKVRETAAGTKVKHTSPSKLLEISIPLPTTKAEQEAIAAALSDVDALINALDRLIAKKRDIKQAAMQELLTGKRRLPGFTGGWETVKFADVVDKNIQWSITGGPFGSNLKASDYVTSGVRIIQLQNIGDGIFLDNYAIYTTEQKADELLSCNIYPGEIILSKMGDPVARACFVPEADRRYLMASDGIRLVPDERHFDKRFVHDYINSIYFRKNAIGSSTGSTRQRIGLGDLKQLPFAQPTLSEQNAIANVFSDMDAEIASLENRRDKTFSLKQGMMQELLTGRIRLVQGGAA